MTAPRHRNVLVLRTHWHLCPVCAQPWPHNVRQACTLPRTLIYPPCDNKGVILRGNR